jgi:4-amino-4-deoxy-L-arabinose transferase-like glycosyltransferase
LAIAVIVYILDREYGLTEAFFGGLFFALAPFAVFYSRATLPDMPSVSMATIALFFFYLYKTRERKNLLYIVLGTAFFALALLIKPVVVFYALIAVFFIWQKHKKVLPSLFWSGFFLMLAALPVLVWRTYIKGFPEGIPANSWLLTSVNTSAGLQSVFFRPAFFRWIFFERLNNLILGGYLTFFFLMGILVVNPKKSKFHLIFGAAALMYLLVFQGGNVQHEYYQTIIIPAVSVLVGVGAGLYLKEKKAPLLILKLLFTITIFVVSFLFSFYLVKDKYSENQGQVLMADVVRSLTKETDIIVTDSMGDTTLLYLADRKGYPAPYRELPLLKEQGARYFVTMNLEYKAKLVPQYKLVFENDSFLIFAL